MVHQQVFSDKISSNGDILCGCSGSFSDDMDSVNDRVDFHHCWFYLPYTAT